MLANNNTVAERPDTLRALPARRAERNDDLASIVIDAARSDTDKGKLTERRAWGAIAVGCCMKR